MCNYQGLSADYVDMEYARNANPLFLNIQWKKIPKPEQPEAEKLEVTKLAIGVEGGFDTGEEKFDYEKTNFLALMPDKVLIPLPQQDLPELISMVVDGIMKASDLSEDEAQVLAWEEKRQVSKYADSLVQIDNGKKISPDPSAWKCEDSGITEGLWLNLSDGYIGSGRAQIGADGQMGGGTGAALKHYQEEKAKGNFFPLAVKLGTITPKGADVYSYAEDEDDMVENPKLAEHLSHWGINMMVMEKTEKTMAELQIDMNMKFDFDKICESGKALQTRSGPGYVGLKNMGNTCYMNSVMQVLCTLPEIKQRYFDRAADVFKATPVTNSADDFTCQMAKLAVGLMGEKYSKAEEGAEGTCVTPQMFKFLVGKGHPEFSTGNQQDAQEYLVHLFNKFDRAEHTKKDGEPQTSKLFEYTFEERLQCLQSNKVRYREGTDKFLALNIPLDAAINAAEVQSYEERAEKRQKSDGGEDKETPVKPKIPFEACLQTHLLGTTVEYKSPVTGQAGFAKKCAKFKTFSKYLLVHMRKYTMTENWQPKKLDVLIKAPETLDLEFMRACGPQPSEELMPEDAPTSASAPVPDPDIVSQLVSMGFGENGCRRAALATNNSSAEAAMEWVFAHMEDANFNDPIEQPAPGGGGGNGGGAQVSAESVEMLMGMGFQKKHAEKALKECGGSLERAADWLFSRMDSLDAMDCDDAPAAEGGPEVAAPEYKAQYKLKGFISHVGSSPSCGHYVCHIKKDGGCPVTLNPFCLFFVCVFRCAH
jgi:ubiquitin carboxyl-terminal hydrolase 5/13